jgi:PD-(D/E)XK endonuclease
METAIRRDPRGQGDQGERSAIAWLLDQGLPVFVPIGHSPDYDLLTDFGSGVARVQVKTSTQWRNNRWEITVCTRGGNRSWSGLVKYLDPSRYDHLFVLVADGRRWFIPAAEVDARSGLHVGGPKYERFEIEPGLPLRPPVPR